MVRGYVSGWFGKGQLRVMNEASPWGARRVLNVDLIKTRHGKFDAHHAEADQWYRDVPEWPALTSYLEEDGPRGDPGAVRYSIADIEETPRNRVRVDDDRRLGARIDELGRLQPPPHRSAAQQAAFDATSDRLDREAAEGDALERLENLAKALDGSLTAAIALEDALEREIRARAGNAPDDAKASGDPPRRSIVEKDVPLQQPMTLMLEAAPDSLLELILRVDSLYRVDPETGDMAGARMPYAIDVLEPGDAGFTTAISSGFNGQTRVPFSRRHLVPLNSRIASIRISRMHGAERPDDGCSLWVESYRLVVGAEAQRLAIEDLRERLSGTERAIEGALISIRALHAGAGAAPMSEEQIQEVVSRVGKFAESLLAERTVALSAEERAGGQFSAGGELSAEDQAIAEGLAPTDADPLQDGERATPTRIEGRIGYLINQALRELLKAISDCAKDAGWAKGAVEGWGVRIEALERRSDMGVVSTLTLENENRLLAVEEAVKVLDQRADTAAGRDIPTLAQLAAEMAPRIERVAREAASAATVVTSRGKAPVEIGAKSDLTANEEILKRLFKEQDAARKIPSAQDVAVELLPEVEEMVSAAIAKLPAPRAADAAVPAAPAEGNAPTREEFDALMEQVGALRAELEELKARPAVIGSPESGEWEEAMAALLSRVGAVEDRGPVGKLGWFRAKRGPLTRAVVIGWSPGTHALDLLLDETPMRWVSGVKPESLIDMSRGDE